MRFAVLGPVLVDGRAPRGAIERTLLSRLLVAHGAPVSSAELIECAWPQERRDGAAGSLRVRLARLRAALEPQRARGSPAEVLVREPGGYRLVLEPGSVDADRFAQLAEEAARLPAPAALDCCERALALWRGEPFAELDLVEAATVEARRLHGVRDRLRHLRALALLDTERAPDAARELAALVDEDPLREELVRDLMRARYRAGRQSEALDAYRALTRRLAEVGLRPGPEVRELETLILRHDLEPAPRPAHPTNVGARVASIVAREEDLARVLACLDAHRLVTLVGPGGVGKTTLAAEAARARLDRLPHGAWIVELAGLGEAAEAVPATAGAVGLRRVGRGAEAEDGEALQLLRERWRGAEVLVVLDGAEHLLPGLGRVALDLAGAGAGVRVLVTSRRPLAVAGEAVVPVSPLAVPEDDAPATVRASPAGRLFLERARAASPGWEPDDAAAVARICRRLDGLPLALELAASRLRALPAHEVAERLGDGLAALGASIDASHRLLSPAERELFRRLSVFEGTFELVDAEHVVAGDGVAREDVLELLVSLVDHSMVHAEGGTPRRYRLLEALRVDAGGRLDERTARTTARRHADHLAGVAAAAAGLVWTAGAEAAGDPLIPRRPDLEAAFAGALRRRDADAALGLAAGLEALHHRLGTVALAVECGEQALALAGGSPERRVLALTWHGAMLVAELRVDDARAALEEALALAGRDARIRALEGQIALCAGDLDAAEAALDGVLGTLVRRRDWFAAAVAAHTLGGVAGARGDAAGALARLREACAHYAACEDVCSFDAAAADLAETAAAAGRGDEAAAVCEHALGLAPQRPLGERNTHLMHEAALAACRAGRLDDAARFAAEAAVAAGRDPVLIGPWHAPAAAGDIALMTGDAAGAREHYREALGLASAVAGRRGRSLPTGLYLMASELRLAQVAGESVAALAHARAALGHAQAVGAPAAVQAASDALHGLEATVAAG